MQRHIAGEAALAAKARKGSAPRAKPKAAKSRPDHAHSRGVSAAQAQASAQHVIDLRSTLSWLRKEGDLIETRKEVDPDLEVTGLQKHLDGGCPVLFHNVKVTPNHPGIPNPCGD